MYLNYYQLSAKPFQITSDPKFLWLGEKHKEALATLRYGIMDNRGFLLLTGEVGTGKTILINQLITTLDVDTVVATLPDPDLISMDFYNLLANGLKMNRTFDSKGEFLIHLRDFLYQSHANKKQVLLVIDESQRLNHHLMEDIRVLSNIELHDRKLINIFFVGQQEFNTILAAPQNRALAQRITVNYHIAPLEKNEISQYVRHRLDVAGSKQNLFSEAAIEEVFQFSGGIPRLINIICDHALLTGYARSSKQIDDRIIKECAEELKIPIKQPIIDPMGQIKAADSKSIVSAAAKTEQELTRMPSSDPQSSEKIPPQAPSQEKVAARSPFLKILYAAMIILLVALAGSAITHFSSKETVRYNAEDLTPDKYKTSLAKEKELLTERLKSGVDLEGNSVDTDSAAPIASDIQKDKKAVRSEPDTIKTTEQPSANQPPVAKDEPPSSQSTLKPIQTVGTIASLSLMKEKVTISFTLNSNEIDSQSYSALDRIAAYLTNNLNKSINVRGYADSSGSPGYNESVSRFRASAVKTYLIGKGVPPEKIQLFAMGDAFPVASNDTSEGRSRNRRVEIEFVHASAAD